jgi:hypothetical protein
MELSRSSEALPDVIPKALPSLNRYDLAQKVAEFRRIVQARAIARAVEKLDAALTAALTAALVDPLREQGAPPEQVEQAEEQVAQTVEVVHQAMRRPRPRSRRPRGEATSLERPVVTPITSGQWKAPEREVGLVPIR